MDFARIVILRSRRLDRVSFTGAFFLGRLFLLQIATKLQHQGLSVCAAFEHHAVFAMSGAKKFCRNSHIAEGCGQSDATYRPAKYYFKPPQERLQLHTAFVADEGVQLVNYNCFESREQTCDLDPAPHKQSLDRFRSDQNNAIRIPTSFCLCGC